MWGKTIELDKIDRFETLNKLIDLGEDHQTVTLDEKSLGKLLSVGLGCNRLSPLIPVVTKNRQSRHCMPV